jgi:hypothetical protein
MAIKNWAHLMHLGALLRFLVICGHRAVDRHCLLLCCGCLAGDRRCLCAARGGWGADGDEGCASQPASQSSHLQAAVCDALARLQQLQQAHLMHLQGGG